MVRTLPIALDAMGGDKAPESVIAPTVVKLRIPAIVEAPKSTPEASLIEAPPEPVVRIKVVTSVSMLPLLVPMPFPEAFAVRVNVLPVISVVPSLVLSFISPLEAVNVTVPVVVIAPTDTSPLASV